MLANILCYLLSTYNFVAEEMFVWTLTPGFMENVHKISCFYHCKSHIPNFYFWQRKIFRGIKSTLNQAACVNQSNKWLAHGYKLANFLITIYWSALYYFQSWCTAFTWSSERAWSTTSSHGAWCSCTTCISSQSRAWLWTRIWWWLCEYTIYYLYAFVVPWMFWCTFQAFAKTSLNYYAMSLIFFKENLMS